LLVCVDVNILCCRRYHDDNDTSILDHDNRYPRPHGNDNNLAASDAGRASYRCLASGSGTSGYAEDVCAGAVYGAAGTSEASSATSSEVRAHACAFSYTNANPATKTKASPSSEHLSSVR
jgi:hypothetical protein